MLEQLARDVTGWNATAVEFFQRLVMTQYMNHLRPQCLAAPDLRRWEPLERLGTAFDSIMHTVDVRRIASQRGRYNIPNIGLFLWRIDAYPLSDSPAVALDSRRWRFHPLGIDQPLYTRPQTDRRVRAAVDAAQRAGDRSAAACSMRGWRLLHRGGRCDQEPAAVRELLGQLPAGRCRRISASAISTTTVRAGRTCRPTTSSSSIRCSAASRCRPVCPLELRLRVDFHYGFSGDLGGGEYDRSASVADAEPPPNLLRVPDDFAHIQDAMNALGANGGVVRNHRQRPLRRDADYHCAGAKTRRVARRRSMSADASARRRAHAQRRRRLPKSGSTAC